MKKVYMIGLESFNIAMIWNREDFGKKSKMFKMEEGILCGLFRKGAVPEQIVNWE